MKYNFQINFKFISRLFLLIIFILLFKAFARSEDHNTPKRDRQTHTPADTSRHLSTLDGRHKQEESDNERLRNGSEERQSVLDQMSDPDPLRVLPAWPTFDFPKIVFSSPDTKANFLDTSPRPSLGGWSSFESSDYSLRPLPSFDANDAPPLAEKDDAATEDAPAPAGIEPLEKEKIGEAEEDDEGWDDVDGDCGVGSPVEHSIALEEVVAVLEEITKPLKPMKVTPLTCSSTTVIEDTSATATACATSYVSAESLPICILPPVKPVVLSAWGKYETQYASKEETPIMVNGKGVNSLRPTWTFYNPDGSALRGVNNDDRPELMVALKKTTAAEKPAVQSNVSQELQAKFARRQQANGETAQTIFQDSFTPTLKVTASHPTPLILPASQPDSCPITLTKNPAPNVRQKTTRSTPTKDNRDNRDFCDARSTNSGRGTRFGTASRDSPSWLLLNRR